MKKYLLFIVLISGLSLLAQELRQLELVGKAEKLTSEIASRRDRDGNMTAAIQVVSDMDGFSYDAFNGVVGKVDNRPGMDIVYVQSSERVLEIYKTGYEPLRVILADIGIRLQARDVWKITLTGEVLQEVQSVVIRYKPEDADLYLDGALMPQAGAYPLTLGAHDLRIEKEGYQPIAEQIVVDEQHVFFEYKLERQPDALVEITTTPAGAKVYLDGVQLGETPVAVYFKAGSYALKIVKEGYVDIENERLDVELPTTRKNYTLEENVGYLTINTHKDAVVRINGRTVTEYKNIKLPPQVMQIEVSMPKAETLKQQVLLDRNDRLNIDLFPKVKTARLQLAVSPFDAQVFLEGDAGESYSATGSKVFENIPVGTYTAIVSAEGYESKVETYTLKLGERLSESIRLEKVFVQKNASKDKATAIVSVTNPKTGRTWMDRNLGATRVAQSSDDELAYGDLYQWGRLTDGHEKRNSGTTSSLSNSDTPGHADFTTIISLPYDWRSPQNNNLWQGVNGTNNPCPAGYRLPTVAEWRAEYQSWSSNNAAGAFNSPLKLPVAGYRDYSNGSLYNVGSGGYYWSATVATVVGTDARYLYFYSSDAYMRSYFRANGRSVRCLKD